MARFRRPIDHSVFVQWLIAYILLLPYTQLLSVAISLPRQGTSSKIPRTADDGHLATVCNPNDQDFEARMLCSQGNVNATSNGTSQIPHIDTPAPGTYTARDPFFIWQQTNFEDSQSLEYYRNWSVRARERRLTAQSGNKIDESRLFVQEHLQWMDFDCGADVQQCGCPMDSNVLNSIIEVIPHDAGQARRVYFTMKMLNWANQLVCQVINAGTIAELALLAKAPEFADIFFIKADDAAKAECDKHDAIVGALVGAGIAMGLTLAMELAAPLGLAGGSAVFGFMDGAAGTGMLMKALAGTAVPTEQGAFAASRNVVTILPAFGRTNVPVQTAAQSEKALQHSLKDMRKLYSGKAIAGTEVDKGVYNFANIAATSKYQTTLDDGGGCGLTLPKDDRESRTATAMIDISARMKMLTELITVRMGLINEGLPPPPEDPQDAPSEMSFHLMRLFGHFIPEERILKAVGDTFGVANSIEQFVTERLVEKAWRTKSCYVHCGRNNGEEAEICSPLIMDDLRSISFCPTPSTACQASCWRGGADMTNDKLYGFDDPTIAGPNWNINLTDVIQGSYWAWYNNQTTYLDDYVNRSTISSINDLANVGGIRLPVCYSDYTVIQDYTKTGKGRKHTNGWSFPCNCGNDWGDNTVPFYRTDESWYALPSSKGYSHLGDYVEMCRSQLQKPLGRQAAKFAANMCYVTMRAYPEDHEMLPSYHEPDRTAEGRKVCIDIIDTVDRMRRLEGKSDGEVDGAVCDIVRSNRGEASEKGAGEGFQRVLHETHVKCK